jgi:hypothetical protein
MSTTSSFARRTHRGFGFAIGALLWALASGASADELERLREENAALRAEVQSLRTRLDALERAAGATEPPRAAATGESATDGATPSPYQPVYVARSRVSLEVGRDPVSGATKLATLWYRTSDSGPLPRKEWIQMGAVQGADGELEGTWMRFERDGGRGSLANVGAGRFTIDGRVVESPRTDYEASEDRRRIGQADTTRRHESARFALPPEALALLPKAAKASFEAGPVRFDLTDEHLAAITALATRTESGSTGKPHLSSRSTMPAAHRADRPE